MVVKKIFQCEECKNYYENAVEVHPESGSKKKKIYVCEDCYEKKINKKQD